MRDTNELCVFECDFNKRIEEIRTITLKNNKDYKYQNIVQADLIKKIQALLPEENKIHVARLNDSSNFQSTIAEEIMYKQGFRDCLDYILNKQ